MSITFADIVNANKLIETMNIKGKEYAEVHQRIKAFRSVFPEGYIRTQMVSNDNGICIFRAEVGFYDEDNTLFMTLGTGTAYEKESGSYINKTSYIENCETSAVGRALGMAGFGIDKSVASAEEVANAILNQDKPARNPKPVTVRPAPEKPEIPAQGYMDESKLQDLLDLASALGYDEQKVVLAAKSRYKKKPTELTEEEYHEIVQIMTGKIADGQAE